MILKPKILSYLYDTESNLGDAIQTLAVIEFLKKNNIDTYEFVDRKNMVDGMLINGWHRYSEEKLPKYGLFLSIHTDKEHLAKVSKNNFIGCRDTYTKKQCDAAKLKSLVTGCITINFPLCDITNNKLILFIDSIHNNSNQLTQTLSPNTDWHQQLELAKERIKLLQTASLVHTTRLHILIPCISMGIPVILDKITKHSPERFSMIKNFISIGKVIERESGIRDMLLDIWTKNSSKIIESHNIENEIFLGRGIDINTF